MNKKEDSKKTKNEWIGYLNPYWNTKAEERIDTLEVGKSAYVRGLIIDDIKKEDAKKNKGE